MEAGSRANDPRVPAAAPAPTPRRRDRLWRRLWRYGRALVAPVLIWVLLGGMLLQPVLDWLHSEEVYDQAAMCEWLEEARNTDSTLAELVEAYARRARQL